MKRWYIVIIAAYLVAMAVVILLTEEKYEKITIITIINHESKLLTTDTKKDSLDLYITEKDSFLTCWENVADASLESENDSIQINLTDIKDLEEKIDLNGETYYHYKIDYAFESVGLSGIITFKNAFFRLVYLNNDEISLSIGDLTYMFSDLDTSNCLDFFNAYGVYDEYDGMTYLAGVTLGLEPLSIGKLAIKNISLGIEGVSIKTGEALWRLDKLYYMVDMSDVLGVSSYDPKTLYVENKELEIDEAGYLFLPLLYNNDLFAIRRFYVMIDYSYLGEDYRFIIDDFPYSSTPSLEDLDDESISRFNYIY